MKKVDPKFKDFLISKAPNQEMLDWIKEEMSNDENFLNCHNCKSINVEIILDASVVVKCNVCDQFSSENVTIDKIPSMSYNAVRFLQEKKIIEILEVQGKI